MESKTEVSVSVVVPVRFGSLRIIGSSNSCGIVRISDTGSCRLEVDDPQELLNALAEFLGKARQAEARLEGRDLVLASSTPLVDFLNRGKLVKVEDFAQPSPLQGDPRYSFQSLVDKVDRAFGRLVRVEKALESPLQPGDADIPLLISVRSLREQLALLEKRVHGLEQRA